MQCILCTTGINETQEHLEKCDFTKKIRKNLDIGKRDDKIVLWRKIMRAVKEIYEPNINVNNKKDNKKTDSNINTSLDTKDCENTPNPDGQGEVLPAPSEETWNRGCEGLETQAVVAISAWDIRVGAVIKDNSQ